MFEKYYISFKNIPKEFKNRERVLFCEFELSGIQNFIFGSLSAGDSAEKISALSGYIVHITDTLSRLCGQMLGKRSGYREISRSSGKILFAINPHYPEKQFVNVCDRLQRAVYAAADGRVQLSYGFVRAVVTNLSGRSSAMFAAHGRLVKNKYCCRNILGIDTQSARIPDFDMVRPEQGGSAKLPFAALKLDLDSLGDFFARLENLDLRKSASMALSTLLEHACAKDGVIPVFVGGDDIFLLVTDGETCLETVRSIYEDIRSGIQTIPELAPYREFFGISAGLCAVRSDLGKVPLVYYNERAEKYIGTSKSKSGKNCVCAFGQTLSWSQLCALCRVYQNNRDAVDADFDQNRRFVIMTSPRALADRILTLDKNKNNVRFENDEEKKLIENVLQNS